MSLTEIRKRFRITKKRWDQDRGDLSHAIKALLPREQAYIVCRRVGVPYKEAMQGLNMRRRSAQAELEILKRFRMQ
jgi:hypothetical protein